MDDKTNSTKNNDYVYHVLLPYYQKREKNSKKKNRFD